MPVRRTRLPHFLPQLFAAVLALGAASSWAGETLGWLAAGRPTPEAGRAVGVLEAAADQGLDPRDYEAAALRQALAKAQAQRLAEAEQAQLDAAITAAVLRYLGDLQRGRVDPREIHAKFDVPQPAASDPQALLREAIAGKRVAETLRDAEPRLPMYATLRGALARYRGLANHPAWEARLSLPGRKLTPGQPYADLAVLAQRLEALGDLLTGTPLPQRFEGPVEAALRSFQERHGLEADGVMGPATLKQLNVTPAERVRQIELSLERLRWTPLLQGPRMVVVNLPEFVLRAYEVEGSQVKMRQTMKVIVGKALDTRTPLIDEPMRYIEFSPYWNVPPSIARDETIPRLRRDPGYFHQQGFEFVTGSGQVVRSLSEAGLDAVLQGSWRIRQRPGPKNALGDIKFVFPNRQNIYLHHTPAVRLFDKERRDFSHGCIRVEHPVELAKFVLEDSAEWTEDRIRQAMERGVSKTVALKNPVHVLVTYSTVVAKGGRIFFYPDLYGHDRVLDQALRARASALVPLLSMGTAPK